jgi:hypothetical protein
MKHIILIFTIALSLSAQETRKFPLSNSDYPAYFDLLGSRKVLMSINTILQKVEATYGEQKNVGYVQTALNLCAHDNNLNYDNDVITGVKVFTDRYGLIRVTVNLNNGNDFTVTLNELVRRKHELSQGE